MKQHIVITGATAGIGRASAITLAEQGHNLTLLNRNPAKADALATEIQSQTGQVPELITMDMASFESVRDAAQQLLNLNKPIDVLLNNAGIVNTERRMTIDGYEETLAVNHLAPFLLTGLVLPALEAAPAARIVNVSSEAHAMARSMGFDDMNAEEKFSTMREYGRSKLANILFTRMLAQKLNGITANSLHPGAVATSLGKQNPGIFSRILPALLKPFFRNPADGAATSIYLCTSPEVADVTGAYFANCKRKKERAWAQDDEAAAQLWTFSEEAVAFSYPFSS